jgi:signal peptidase II
VKFIHVVLIVITVLILDQVLKIHIKTNYVLGQEKMLINDWARLNYIENEGMAFGLKFGGYWGKVALTVFRLLASIFGFYFINQLIKSKSHNGLVFCASLVLAGAIGNLIDCMFYGLIFNEGGFHSPAKLVPFGKGYGTFLQGKVVDMLYFPLFNFTWPSWLPVIGGKPFEFFSLIFNIADAAISTGVISILVFHKKLLNFVEPKEESIATTEIPLEETTNDNSAI